MTGPGEPGSRAQRPLFDLVAALFLLVATALYVFSAARAESYGSDTSMYFGLAQSMVSGDGYVFNHVPHTVYPPGYPLFLAALMAVVGESFATLMRVAVPVYLIGVGCIYWLFRGERGQAVALAVTVLCAASYSAFFLTVAGLHSDVLYFTVAAAALLCVDLVERSPAGRRRTALIVLACGLVAYLSLVRSIGVTLVAGLALWMALPVLVERFRSGEDRFARARRWGSALALSTVVLGAWMGWSAQQGSYAGDGHMASYTQQLLKADPHQIDAPTISVLELPQRAARFLDIRLRRASQMLLNLQGTNFTWTDPLEALILLGVLTTIAVGLGRSLVVRATLTDCYVLAYGGLLLLWPFDEGVRFLFPLLPFLLLYAIEGIDWVGGAIATRGPWRSFGPQLLTAGKGFLLIAVVALGVRPSIDFSERSRAPTAAVTSNAPTLAAVDWIERNTGADDVIMLDEFAVMHRLTGRRTYRFPLLTDVDRIEEIMAQTSTDYVVVLRESVPAYFLPGTEARFESVRVRDPERYRVVHDYGRGVVYRVGG